MKECFPEADTGERMFRSEERREAESSSFFGKLVMSNVVLLGHIGERMFGYSKHVKGHLMEYKYDPTDSGGQHRALVCFAPLAILP